MKGRVSGFKRRKMRRRRGGGRGDGSRGDGGEGKKRVQESGTHLCARMAEKCLEM